MTPLYNLARAAHTRVSALTVIATALLFTVPGCRRGARTAPSVVLTPVAVKPAGPPPLSPLPAGGVKAIYLTGWTAGLHGALDRLVGVIDRTELNGMVIDVKDDGEVAYNVDVPLVKEIKASRRMYRVDRVMSVLKAHDIWPIARIACMRDTPLARAHPELAVHDQNGKPWHDRSGHYWLNPYQRKVWDYNVDIALDCLKHGFKEIQFDYVRFPSEGDIKKLTYDGKPAGDKREDEIAAFMKYAHDKIHAAGGWFAADIFGLTSMVKDDEGIGQKFQKIDQYVDFLCPMVYPSHYAYHEYGIPDPNREPYKIITLSVGDAQKRLKGASKAELRPWIQDFNLRGVTYGPAQVKAEIKALNDLGIHQFLIWNPKCHYHETALATAPAPPHVAAAQPMAIPVADTQGTPAAQAR